jgi:sugar/nucleoside kinase (ribokinase family)
VSRLAIVGSIALDEIEGPAGKRTSVLGGSATYAAYAASFFTRPSLFACVGGDFPLEAHKVFAERPIDTSGLLTLEGRTFRWTGRYSAGFRSRDTLSLDLGVFKDFVPKLPGRFQAGEVLFLGNIDPDLQLAVLEQAGPEAWVAMDTIDHWIKTKREALLKGLRRAHVFFLNDSEAELLAEESNLIVAGARLRALGPRAVVIKKGEHGSLLFTEAGVTALPALPLEKVVDPTGAGDVFAGAMLGVLAGHAVRDNAALRAALARATVMASFVVEDFGLERLRRLDGEQIDRRLAQLSDLVRF